MSENGKNIEKQKEPLRRKCAMYARVGAVQQLDEHFAQVTDAQTLRRIFEMYSKEGRSIEEVCESLNLTAKGKKQ